MFCLAAVQRRPVQYHSRWLLIVLCLSVHVGQLAPNTLPQCRLVSNSRSGVLSLSLSLSLWPFCSVGLSVCVCVSPSLSLCVSPSSASQGVFSFSSPSLGGFPSFSPSPPFLSAPLSPESLPRLTPPSACWLISGISPFAWRGAASSEKVGGHEATETGLAYAPVSQAHGHNHIVHCFAYCTAA